MSATIVPKVLTKGRRRANRAERRRMQFRTSSKPCSDLFDEIVVDNFAGGGGASMGIERALGRSVDIAINHNVDAVEMHKTNHPHTLHLCEDVWSVDPVEAVAGRKVGLAWFSPDCKHFSRAKGARPVSKKIRGLAWVVIKWAKAVAPRVIMLENVREFEDWGPLGEDDRPCPIRKGQTFLRWVRMLKSLGYEVQWRTLNAADYGAPTHRKRLFLIARRDGAPIVWPEPTHGPGRKPYRTAASCIDWSLPCPSIFLTKAEGRAIGVKRPLADKTMRRIAMGIKRYVIDSAKPFIVRICQNGSNGSNTHDVEKGLTTIVSKAEHCLVTPTMLHVTHDGERNPIDPAGPLPTVTGANRGEIAVAAPLMVGAGGAVYSAKPKPCDDPKSTVLPQDRSAVVAAFLAKHNTGVVGQGMERPVGTVTAIDHHSLVAATVVRQNHGEKTADDVDEPLRTVTTQDNKHTLVSAALVGVGGRAGQSPPCGADEPVRTTTAKADRAVATAHLVSFYGEAPQQETRGGDVQHPLNTVVPTPKHAVVTSNVVKFRGDSPGTSVEDPLPTITAGDGAARPAGAAHALGVEAATLIHFNHGEKQWSSPEDPHRTVPAGGLHAAEVRAFLTKYFGTAIGQSVNDPLHTVTSKDRFNVVVVHINGEPYVIADIGLRMLTPRELARAQGFPDDYVLTGTNSSQVARIGNSVCPVMAEVLVRANVSQVASAAA